MLFKIIIWLRGYLVIESCGSFIERFINLCMYNKIYLWDIKKTGKNTSLMKISIKGFKRIEKITQKTKTRVKIVKKCGLPLFIHRYRNRYAFLHGALMFLVIIFTLSSFLWSVEITGCEKIEENRIRNALLSCGISPGVVKYNIDSSEIKEKMLKEIPELSWCWVQIKGTRALCEVREKTPVPEIVPADIPCNIVALKGGVIRSMKVIEGETLSEEGKTVFEGELLVSGAISTKTGGTRLVHADGNIFADTFYEKEATFPLYFEEEIDTGQSLKRHSISFGSFNINLWFGKENKYEQSRSEEKVFQTKLWGDFYLPLSFKTKQIFETQKIRTDLLEKEAKEYFGEQLFSEIMQNLPEGTEVVSKDLGHTLNDDGTITVKCSVCCREDIAKKIQIEKEQ